MANNYSNVVASETIPCSQEDYDELVKLMGAPDDEEVDFWHGMTTELYKEGDTMQLHMFSEESGDLSEIPEAALEHLGKIIKKAGKEFWEFGVAWTCSKYRPGEFGGTAERICTDGSIWYRTETWENE